MHFYPSSPAMWLMYTNVRGGAVIQYLTIGFTERKMWSKKTFGFLGFLRKPL
ncbi:hypothetical protein SAMN05216233_104170 [Desulfoluna spongiiphila]|uniref:Uncharacterized protein n=1 Tax=Desulfoluna spongiiphila TaxID=419481 RepID=A0A1G5DFW2_9BACT|nr:hypothetical protein SAMN05216233_104170 [Desulfoluna spongiiphila]